MRQLRFLKLCLLPALLIAGSGLAHATEIKGTAGFRATAFSDATDRSQSVGLIADLGLKHALGQDWKANIDLGARLET